MTCFHNLVREIRFFVRSAFQKPKIQHGPSLAMMTRRYGVLILLLVCFCNAYDLAAEKRDQFASLIAFQLLLMKVLDTGLSTYCSPTYKLFCKQIGNGLRQSVRELCDFWMLTRNLLRNGEDDQLQREVDRVVILALQYIVNRPGFGLWQFLVDLPFDCVTDDCRSRCEYLLRSVEKITVSELYDIPLSELLARNGRGGLKERAEAIGPLDSVFLVNTLAAVVSYSHGGPVNFVKEIVEICFCDETSRESLYKVGSEAVALLLSRKPNIFDQLLIVLDRNMSHMDNYAINVLTTSNLCECKLSPSSLSILGKWLIYKPPDDAANRMARRIMSSVYWGMNEAGDQLWLDPSVHEICADTVMKAHSMHCGNSNGMIAKSIRQVSKLASRMADHEHLFNQFCWDILIKLKISSMRHYREVSSIGSQETFMELFERILHVDQCSYAVQWLTGPSLVPTPIVRLICSSLSQMLKSWKENSHGILSMFTSDQAPPTLISNSMFGVSPWATYLLLLVESRSYPTFYQFLYETFIMKEKLTVEEACKKAASKSSILLTPRRLAVYRWAEFVSASSESTVFPLALQRLALESYCLRTVHGVIYFKNVWVDFIDSDRLLQEESKDEKVSCTKFNQTSDALMAQNREKRNALLNELRSGVVDKMAVSSASMEHIVRQLLHFCAMHLSTLDQGGQICGRSVFKAITSSLGGVEMLFPAATAAYEYTLHMLAHGFIRMQPDEQIPLMTLVLEGFPLCDVLIEVIFHHRRLGIDKAAASLPPQQFAPLIPLAFRNLASHPLSDSPLHILCLEHAVTFVFHAFPANFVTGLDLALNGCNTGETPLQLLEIFVERLGAENFEFPKAEYPLSNEKLNFARVFQQILDVFSPLIVPVSSSLPPFSPSHETEAHLVLDRLVQLFTVLPHNASLKPGTQNLPSLVWQFYFEKLSVLSHGSSHYFSVIVRASLLDLVKSLSERGDWSTISPEYAEELAKVVAVCFPHDSLTNPTDVVVVLHMIWRKICCFIVREPFTSVALLKQTMWLRTQCSLVLREGPAAAPPAYNSLIADVNSVAQQHGALEHLQFFLFKSLVTTWNAYLDANFESPLVIMSLNTLIGSLNADQLATASKVLEKTIRSYFKRTFPVH
ncbi:unnamed protein product [Angiostrongylus costaricensis]|uniref:Rapamycin-insensitive companion of mTOR n=1 Tax=Angiostrongylus costaricensis TaxID=334426 RepID=A0A158PM14_ANGCS|nr:unnamed protein product [Angiostrongylus costaricensis]